jgi:hypothetical protein
MRSRSIVEKLQQREAQRSFSENRSVTEPNQLKDGDKSSSLRELEPEALGANAANGQQIPTEMEFRERVY